MTRLLLDFGLFVLIWMVQLIVYPSFIHFTREGLVKWHKKYTPRISFLVVPLMLGQLMAYGALLQEVKSFYSITCFILVLLVWLVTFTFFVPRHKAISAGDFTPKSLEDMVRLNWIRTVLWTVLFLWNFAIYF
ncbi:hypothetical protein SAMN06265375_103151 [Muriicola jejuensis]|nr:hypothetical protein [Muriicola jejuensis]SMP20411.1 hypothetical protein SAMN06265375_103151 [Muriicola jejuensis]